MNENQALASLVEDYRDYLHEIIAESYSLNCPREQIEAFLELLPSKLHGEANVPLGIPTTIVHFVVKDDAGSNRYMNTSGGVLYGSMDTRRGSNSRRNGQSNGTRSGSNSRRNGQRAK